MRRYENRAYADDYNDDDRYTRRKSDSRRKAEYNRHMSLPQYSPAYHEDDEFTREIKVNRDFDPIISADRRKSSEYDDYRIGRLKSQTQKRQPDHVMITDLTKIDIRALFVGAPAHTVRQSIDVERLEDDLIFDLNTPEYIPSSSRSRRFSSTGENGTTSPSDEYDKVQDSLEMDVKDGRATLISRVRSEKIVPILGSEEMFKKSGVLVTRRIEIDLLATPTRRSLYELILWRQREGGAFDSFSRWRAKNSSQSGELLGLTKRENAELQRAFLGLAELYKMI